MDDVTVTPERPEGVRAPPPPPPRQQRLRRDSDRALIGGVCSGIANRLGIDPLIVRLAFVAAAVAGGWGIVLYLLGWAFIPAEAGHGRAPVRRLTVGRKGWQVAIGIGLLVLSVMLLAREGGLWFSDAFVWPVVLAAGGAALIWRQSQSNAASTKRESTWQSGPEAPPDTQPTSSAGTGQEGIEPPVLTSIRMATAEARRVLEPGEGTSGKATLGVALVIAAAVVFLWLNDALAPARDVLLAIIVVVIAAALILAPWWLRLVRGLAAERAERIRSQERAEMAAHLHDSVLQTLALVQRRADDPGEVAALARRQERELRAWLNNAPRPTGTVAAALEAAAAEVEASHGVAVDVVAVGDAPLDEAGEAVVAAAREALVNAAKFAGGPVSVYAEAGDERIEVFVRDRGPGFDLDEVPGDRRGVRESILGRMERHGGRARVHTAAGGGTEVELVMEREP
jgi:phage shock protein PspC (stress-responsive transcriptional regulator)/signal transduction histidine kinase